MSPRPRKSDPPTCADGLPLDESKRYVLVTSAFIDVGGTPTQFEEGEEHPGSSRIVSDRPHMFRRVGERQVLPIRPDDPPEVDEFPGWSVPDALDDETARVATRAVTGRLGRQAFRLASGDEVHRGHWLVSQAPDAFATRAEVRGRAAAEAEARDLREAEVLAEERRLQDEDPRDAFGDPIEPSSTYRPLNGFVYFDEEGEKFAGVDDHFVGSSDIVATRSKLFVKATTQA